MQLDCSEFSNAASYLQYALKAFNNNNANFLEAFAEIMGMVAENQIKPGTYSKEDFENVPVKHGCHSNAVISSFQF